MRLELSRVHWPSRLLLPKNRYYDIKEEEDVNEVPVELIVAAFQDEKSAAEALKVLKQARREKLIDIQNAAVLRKDAKGKLHIQETADMGGGKGATLGGIAGAAIGLIAGPALLVPAAVGALVGGLAAKLRDSGFSNERLQTLGENLQPGSSAIVAVVEHRWVAEVEQAMAEAGADAVTAALGADIAAQLEAGHEVAYTAISSEEGFSAARLAGGEDSVEGGKIVVDDSGVYGGRFFATEEGFVVEELAADDEGVEYLVAAGLVEEEPADAEAAEDEKPQ
jgi:uncharacterized membrane protein